MGRMYSHLRESGKRILNGKMPTVWELARRSGRTYQGQWVLPGTLFEEMGFNYIWTDGRS